MSELPKSSTLLDPCSKKFSGNVFSQLRNLASEVETGIEHFQEELDSTKIKRDNNSSHALAINFLLHTKKDIAQLKSEALVKCADFSKENDKMSRVSELIKSVMALQSQRLENVESYLEKYGYKRPVFASEEQSRIGAIEISDSADDTNNCADDKSDIEDDNTSINCDGNESPKTPSSEKRSGPSLMRTPRLEDIFKDLSEDSIHLIKQSWRCTSQDTTKENVYNFSTTNNDLTSFHGNTNQIKSGTPEQPKLLTTRFSLNSYDQIYEHSKQNSQQVETSNFDSIFPRTPEMPKLLTQVFEFDNISKEATTPSQNSFTGNTDLPLFKGSVADLSQTPEPPALLTGLITFNNQAGKYETLQSGVVSPSASPETPKLVTPGFKLSRFSNRVTGSEEPSEPDPQVKMTDDIRTPEAPILLSSGFNLNISSFNPTERGGRFARSLFNSPPKPELKLHTTVWKNDLIPGNKENFQCSLSMCHPTPEVPKLLSQDLDSKSRFGYRGTSYMK